MVHPARLIWIDDERDDAAVTTVNFEELHDRTKPVLREALDQVVVGIEAATLEQFEHLDQFLNIMGKNV